MATDKLNVIRKIDELGRIVIPIDMRNQLAMECGTEVVIHFEKDHLTISKPMLHCALCGSTTGLKTMNGRYICSACVETIMAQTD